MYKLIFLLLISSAAFGQTNCTKLTKTTTGISIQNNGMSPAKYRIEVSGRPDSVTALLGVGKTLLVNIAWCNDSLYVTAQPTGSCSCKLDRLALYYKCTTTAIEMDVKASREGNTITYELTKHNPALETFTVHWKSGSKAGSFLVDATGHGVGEMFIYKFKIPD